MLDSRIQTGQSPGRSLRRGYGCRKEPPSRSPCPSFQSLTFKFFCEAVLTTGSCGLLFSLFFALRSLKTKPHLLLHEKGMPGKRRDCIQASLPSACGEGHRPVYCCKVSSQPGRPSCSLPADPQESFLRPSPAHAAFLVKGTISSAW